jgi:hypothetical protein
MEAFERHSPRHPEASKRNGKQKSRKSQERQRKTIRGRRTKTETQKSGISEESRGKQRKTD